MAIAWEALDGSGRQRRGHSVVADPKLVLADLQQRGWIPVKVETVADRPHGGVRRALMRLRPVSGGDLIFCLRQWAMMLSAGVGIRQVLATTAATGHPRLGAVIRAVGQAIEGGMSFADALAQHSGTFHRDVVAAVRAGELSGRLDEVLRQLAQRLEVRRELRTKVVSALIYPSVVTLMAIGVVAFLVTVVIPRFEAFFSRRGTSMPLVTSLLTSGAEAIRIWGPWVLLTMVALIIVTVLIRRYSAASARRIDAYLMHIPIIGGVLRCRAVAGSCDALSMLLASGVSLPAALRTTAHTIGNQAIAQQLHTTEAAVVNGRPLAEGLRRPPMPVLVHDVVKIGEESGHLDGVLQHLSEHYADELDTRLRRMMALFEPTVLVLIGGMVGFVYLAFFQAIFAIAQG
ncbi:MAG: type II secretion system F family protein [Planctomycetota bacterium]|nr:MAG: type II secretion system F family protein [Planctomycetota bacterium]